MHIFVNCAVAAVLLLLSPSASAQATSTAAGPDNEPGSNSVTPWQERPWSARRPIMEAIHGSRIRRRDTPARIANISDEEVREIESVMREQHPGAVVNIGTVLGDCICEDGPQCSEQVWVVAYLPQASQGLQLSRINERWQLGPLQRWWLRYEDFHQRPYPQGRIGDPEFAARVDAYVAEQTALFDSFPHCQDRGLH